MPTATSTANTFAVLPPDLLAQLDEIGRSHVAGDMVTWAKCRQIGATFAEADSALHKPMRRYLATEYRLSRNQVSNHAMVHAITHDLPDATLEMVPWSVAHLIRKRHRDNLQGARAELLDIIDNDRSLVAQRLEALKAATKGAREATAWQTLLRATPASARKGPPTEANLREIAIALAGLLRDSVR